MSEKNTPADEKNTLAEKSPEERTAEAVAQREAGDPRPVSQIEGENLSAEDALLQREAARVQQVADLEQAKADRKNDEREGEADRKAGDTK
jgi:hypothetical protein